jgi:hypothetical protein
MIVIHANKPIGLTGSLLSGRPSDHGATKASLTQRNITFSSEDTQALDFYSAWDKVLKQYMPQTKSSDCLQLLTDALVKGTYANEDQFDVALFDALKEGLDSSVTVEIITTKRTVDGKTEEKKRNLIVVNNLRWTEKDSEDWLHECAIAFTTQVMNNRADRAPCP